MPPLALAWRNLTHHRVRTLVATAGVGFAVLLVLMQVGFYRATGRTASMLYDHLDFDLLLVSAEHQDLSRLAHFPRDRAARAGAAAGVRAVTPLTVGVGVWRNPPVPASAWDAARPPAGTGSNIYILAAPPSALADAFVVGDDGAFPDPAAAAAAGRLLAQLDTVLLDRQSRPEFGRYEFLRTLPPDQGARLNGQPVEVVGEFDLGSGFCWKGLLLTGEATFARLTYRPPDEITFGLVKVRPGADPLAVRRELRLLLPEPPTGDVRVLTRAEAVAEEERYWVRGNAIGELLLAGAVLAVAVGVVFLYQMMSADIRSRLSEYATAKALGYPPGYLRGVVLWQAALLGAAGFVPGVAAAAGLYRITARAAGLPMELEPAAAVGVFALAVGMSTASGLLALRKVATADPASLF